MAGSSEGKSVRKESFWARWRAHLIAAVALLLALAVLYFALSAFIPRWWAQRIGDMSGHGSFAKGIGSGLMLGLICTGIPLLLVMSAFLLWRRRGGKFFAGVLAPLALIIAVPNLMTLTIVLGTSDSAHAGERVLDVEAPGFRGATAIGAIVALLIVLVVVYVVVRNRRRRAKAEKQRVREAAVAQDPATE
ncbi:permease [Mycobacterium sp. CBMA271]|uniref:permease n=1 Tax=unclassified Mycobacteroides TaxID=2618759 RepID=UPI0012DDA650|nr:MULTISPECIES: permease [unclassified Mycobacteroides]MUM17967.1 permease [Mycobacteroides sp. CBMA 326]MUM22168.1 permease [Mycobacteroides sp. CBMA 271]